MGSPFTASVCLEPGAPVWGLRSRRLCVWTRGGSGVGSPIQLQTNLLPHLKARPGLEEPLLSCSLVWQVAGGLGFPGSVSLSSEQGGHLSPGAQSNNKGTRQCLTHVGTHTLSLLPYPVGDAHGCCRSTWMPGAWAHQSPSWRLLPPLRAARLASESPSLSCRAGPARPLPAGTSRSSR